MDLLFDYEIFVMQKYGGVSRYFYEIIARICDIDEVNVSLYLGLNNSGYDFERLSKKMNFQGKTVKLADKIHFMFNILNKRMFNNYVKHHYADIIHKTFYSNVGLMLNAKQVCTVHDMIHERYPQYFARNDMTGPYKKICADLSHGIICVSENTKRDMMEILDVHDKKIKVIYHGLTKNKTDDSERIVKQPYILYVGLRRGYKNFRMLLEAFNGVEVFNKNFKLVCFGGGDFNYAERVYIRHHNLEEKVIFVGGSDYVLSNMYKYASVFVYTSIYEGFGFPPLEAMQCGCPVLTSYAGSVEEIVGDAALLFDASNMDEFIQKLDRILTDNELRKHLIENGYERAKFFTWEKCVREHFEFYKEIKNS
jgi:glycosyltransferase involved in cell wall biosynthesis